MKNLHINKNIILVVALIVVAIIGYYTFASKPAANQALTTSTTVDTSSAVGGELVVELNRLKALQNVDTSFLSDPAFQSLQDFTQPVPPQPLGRGNPFAPVGSN